MNYKISVYDNTGQLIDDKSFPTKFLCENWFIGNYGGDDGISYEIETATNSENKAKQDIEISSLREKLAMTQKKLMLATLSLETLRIAMVNIVANQPLVGTDYFNLADILAVNGVIDDSGNLTMLVTGEEA